MSKLKVQTHQRDEGGEERREIRLTVDKPTQKPMRNVRGFFLFQGQIVVTSFTWISHAKTVKM